MTDTKPKADENGAEKKPELHRPPLKAGIYLQEKKGLIGTGSTAKEAQYRSFWATISISEHSAELMLLNDDFKITGIKEVFSRDEVTGPGWYFIAEGEKRYGFLRPQLDKFISPPADDLEVRPVKKAAPKSSAAPKAAGGNWWEGRSEEGPAKDIFARDKAAEKPAAPKKGQWWEK